MYQGLGLGTIVWDTQLEGRPSFLGQWDETGEPIVFTDFTPPEDTAVMVDTPWWERLIDKGVEIAHDIGIGVETPDYGLPTMRRPVPVVGPVPSVAPGLPTNWMPYLLAGGVGLFLLTRKR